MAEIYKDKNNNILMASFTSNEVAEALNIPHSHLLNDIRNLLKATKSSYANRILSTQLYHVEFTDGTEAYDIDYRGLIKLAQATYDVSTQRRLFQALRHLGLDTPKIPTVDNVRTINKARKSNVLTMGSREISERTGKNHKNILRDIRKMLVEIDRLTIEPIYYVDTQGKKQPEYFLDFNLLMTLLTGYSISLRYSVISRWRELELGHTNKKALN